MLSYTAVAERIGSNIHFVVANIISVSQIINHPDRVQIDCCKRGDCLHMLKKRCPKRALIVCQYSIETCENTEPVNLQNTLSLPKLMVTTV